MELFYEVLFFFVCFIMLWVHLLCMCLRKQIPTPKYLTNQDEDVWNISARVNQQTQNTEPNWPTHDTRIPVEDFVLRPDYTLKDSRPPPPPYAEVDLPSYEQATGCRPPKPDIPVVHMASASQRDNPGPSS